MTTATDHRPSSKVRFGLSSHRVVMRDEEEVAAYLDEHADLCDAVESVGCLSRKEFGPDAELSVRLYRDPETDDQYLQLLVRMTAYPADTMQRIQAVSDAHQDALWDKSGAILVTTDFRPLR